jgi:hypothetical protein
VQNGNRSIRFKLVGTQSNRDGIGAVLKVFAGGQQQTRMVRSGSSYLSQSELPVTFGVGRQTEIERAVVEWPSGRNEEYKKLKSGESFQITESKGVTEYLNG